MLCVGCARIYVKLMSRPDLKSTLAGLIIKDVQSVNGKKEFSVYN